MWEVSKSSFVRLQRLKVNVAEHWGWCVRGCGFEGLGLRNCWAGLLDVIHPLPASLVEEISHETPVLETLTRDLWRKPRMQRSLWRVDA